MMAERRELPRIVPLQPILGTVGTQRVRLLDISIRSARVAHRFPLGEEPYEFQFAWDGQEVLMTCLAMRSTEQGGEAREVPETVLLFQSMSNDSKTMLSSMIERHIERALDEQRSNAYSLPPSSTTYLKTNPQGAGYIRCELSRGKWHKSATTDSTQPTHGFTVSAHEEEKEVELLCQTYLSSDRQGRNMIQRMAAISVSSLDGVATRRFTP